MSSTGLPDNPTGAPIRVLLTDDQPLIRLGLEKLFENSSPAVVLVAMATNAQEARRMVRETQFDILLMDLHFNNGKGADLLPQLIKDRAMHALVFAATRDMGAADRAVINGARGLINKEDAPRTLLQAICKVHLGELWLDRATTSRIFAEFSRNGGKAATDTVALKIQTLSRKERVIVAAFATMPGAQNKQIASQLHISDHTLRNHLTSIFEKLDISSRFELFTFAKRHQSRIKQAIPADSTETEASDSQFAESQFAESQFSESAFGTTNAS